MKTVIVNAHVISPGVDIPCAAIEIVDGKIVNKDIYEALNETKKYDYELHQIANTISI